jgi:hypothetical protein
MMPHQLQEPMAALVEVAEPEAIFHHSLGALVFILAQVI